MIKAVILIAQNFQDEEYIYPYYRMLEEGYDVVVASPDGEDKFGKFGVPGRVTAKISDLNYEDFDLVFLPGGFESPDRLRMIPEVKIFVHDMFVANKLIAAICHGPWICISAGIVSDCEVTGYISIKDDLENAGAVYIDQPVVVDGNLITAPHYKNNPEFMKAVVEYINDL